MPKKLQLIPEFADRQTMHRDDVDERRWQAPLRYARGLAEHMAARIAESRKRFGRKFHRGCCHSHTQHSDGIGTVAETAEMVEAAGLDFQYVTDHWGVTQAPECRKHGLWLGQEPGTEYHHLGILGLDHAFVPAPDLVADFAEVRKRGGTPFIPHPAGWFPRRVYTEEQKNALWQLPQSFMMEVINGAHNLATAYDYTDASAVELWDRLLNDGRRVMAMGNTDAHAPHQIGIVWNGVSAPRCDHATIVSAMSKGRSFASEAPLLHLAVGGVNMGGRVRDRNGAETARIKVADAGGLICVRLVGDGKVRRTWHPNGDEVFEHEQKLPKSLKRYVRVEAIADDGRRGYSNPVYLQ